VSSADATERLIDGKIWDKRPAMCAKCCGMDGGVSSFHGYGAMQYYCDECHHDRCQERCEKISEEAT